MHRRFFTHVEARAVGALTRDLAIRARVFTPQRYDKNMEWGYLLQERHPASQPSRQKLPLRFLGGPGDQMSRRGLFVKTAAGLQPKVNNFMQYIVSHPNDTANHVHAEPPA